jgi:predicted nucleic acid-binding Zn ribbon protein
MLSATLANKGGSHLPSYEYRCDICTESIEKEFPITAEKPANVGTCSCGGTFKRIYHSIPTHLKGTGWGKDK